MLELPCLRPKFFGLFDRLLLFDILFSCVCLVGNPNSSPPRFGIWTKLNNPPDVIQAGFVLSMLAAIWLATAERTNSDLLTPADFAASAMLFMRLGCARTIIRSLFVSRFFIPDTCFYSCSYNDKFNIRRIGLNPLFQIRSPHKPPIHRTLLNTFQS